MTVLNPDKLHVTYLSDVSETELVQPRRYTLTHSDRTGDLFLTIGQEFDRSQISGWYTRLMRDEVLAEWKRDQDWKPWSLHVYCHVSGGLVLGSARWRYNIFNHHMGQVIQAFRYGDRHLLKSCPELDQVAVIVHFQAKRRKYNKAIDWGKFGDYHLDTIKARSSN
ncbi:MAG: staygreen family protein [Candidatus Promineifilaceae bacterium]